MPIDRRNFLRSAAVSVTGLGLVGAGCATPGGAGSGAGPYFQHGVASGDPLEDRVILWTRVTPRAAGDAVPIAVRWWIGAEDSRRVPIAAGVVTAREDRDYTVKVDVAGLEAGTNYCYGFEADGVASPLGYTRTLPAVGVERVRLAFASCANYPQGYFNGYAHIATRDDLDAVLHLGDYLYEYANGEYGDGTPLGRIPAPDRETVSLADYRLRHATYKTDPDLQAAHARHPWITVWDDHESANNSHRYGAHNHDEETEGDWETRRRASIRAYSEWMPVRDQPTGIFRTFRFGDLLDLVMLDTRLHGRDPQPARDPVIANDSGRTLLGSDQMEWLLDALSASNADGVGWRVIGQQVLVSPFELEDGQFNPDAWDGYGADRKRIFDHLATESIDNIVFLTGDVHSSWAFEVPNDEGALRCALEFVCPAISSPPFGKEVDLPMERLPHLVYHDLLHNGYGVVELTPESVRLEYAYSLSVKQRSARAISGPVFEAAAGTHRLVRV